MRTRKITGALMLALSISNSALAQYCEENKAATLSLMAQDAISWRITNLNQEQRLKGVIEVLVADRQWPEHLHTLLEKYVLVTALGNEKSFDRNVFITRMSAGLDDLCESLQGIESSSASNNQRTNTLSDGTESNIVAQDRANENREQNWNSENTIHDNKIEQDRVATRLRQDNQVFLSKMREREVQIVAEEKVAEQSTNKEALLENDYKVGEEAIAGLRRVVDKAETYLRLGPQPVECAERKLDFPRCVEFGIERATDFYRQYVEAQTRMVTLDAGDARTKRVSSKRGEADGLYARAQGLTFSNLRNYAIFSGPSYSLQADNGWKSGGEFLFRAESDTFRSLPFTSLFSEREDPIAELRQRSNCGMFFAWCRGFAEISYVSDSGLPGRNTTSPGDPLGSIDGVFRVNTGLQLHWNETFGIQFGAGMTASSDGSENQVNADARTFFGLHTQTPYPDGAQGQFFIGAAHDNFWDDVPQRPVTAEQGFISSDDDRWIIDGQLRFPGLGLGAFKLAARLYLDAPHDRKGRSEVRAGLLFYYDFDALTKGRNPVPAAGK